MVYAPALSSSAFFAPALYSLHNASDNVSISTARLSSGNRLYRIGDDVAAFSVATRLQSQLSGLKQAALNTAQADSLLQVASGGLTQIRDILDQMTSIATQSNSASLASADRAYLQAEFAELIEEIDRIADNTKFGNVFLLDGTLSGENQIATTTTAATKASGSLVLNTNFSNGETVIVNGVEVTAGALNDFTIGGDSAASIINLAEFLNTSTDLALSRATYTPSGNALLISYDAGGKLGNQFTISDAGTADVSAAGAATADANVFALTGGLDNGLQINSTKATGTIGDPVVNTQSQTSASITLYFTGNASDSETLDIDDGDGGTVTFTFKDSPTLDTHIQVGSDAAETIQNIIETLTQYSGDDDYVVRQLAFTRDGDNLVISNKNVGPVYDLSGAAADISEGITNASLSGSSFSGGTTTGVDVSGVTNSSFIGSISGFSATYVGADSVTASLIVGGITYSASITDTTPGSNTKVRFNSSTGGFFDVQLATGGFTVSNQPTASEYALRLNAAFSGLTFYQDRAISDFSATGSLVGATASIQKSGFTNAKIDSITVTAPTGDDAVIDITVNGEVFRSASGIGGSVGAYETIKFTSLTDANNVITFTNGSTANDFSTANAAATFQTALRGAFGLNSAGQGVDFQIGTTSTDKINVVVGNASSSEIFSGVTPDVSTQDNAEDALDTLEAGREAVMTMLAKVGAYQARLSSASANIQSSITGVTAAHSQLADTDIAEESTFYAQETLKVNAAVAIIAQTAQLQSSLLQALNFGS